MIRLGAVILGVKLLDWSARGHQCRGGADQKRFDRTTLSFAWNEYLRCCPWAGRRGLSIAQRVRHES